MTFKIFSGLYTAVITPFKNGKIDESAFEKILNHQISGGVDGIVVAGTTGECSTLSHDEQISLIKLAVKINNKRVQIIAGTGSNSTSEAILLTSEAEQCGVDGALVVAPYYNRGTQEGLFLHFSEIAKNTKLPIILYNVPARTVVNISDDTIARIAKQNQNVIGVKDASGDLARVPILRSKIGNEFTLLSGEDMTALAFNVSGGNGVISVTSNVAPRLCKDLQDATLSKFDLQKAITIQQKLVDLHDTMFCEVNPIPVKYAMHLMGFCEAEYRLPLCKPSDSSCKKIEASLRNVGLI